jgi:uncharacterized membrane protein YgdD (TMEM256/DUF423 family)
VKTALAIGAVNGFLAVLLGAFGAHALRSVLTPDSRAIYETAAHYHLIHAVALMGIACLYDRLPPRLARVATILFGIGILVFCGSLYVLAATGMKWLGAVTPLGGLSFLAGWAALAAAAMKS